MDIGEMVDIVVASFNTQNIAQGLVIAFVAFLMLRRYSQVLIFGVVCLIFDLLLVPLALSAVNGAEFSNLTGDALDLIKGYGSDPAYVVIRFVFFFMVMSLLHGLRGLFRRT